ncbi:MAG: hypothetical protein LBR13_03370, partial [Dysgonamonadaceae bacterium]|nr:hypothetical protein [Dysgonamonadaceae bacterium]
MRHLIVTLLIVFGLYAQAQKSERLGEIYGAEPLKIVKPIEIDTVDSNGKKFSYEALLQLKDSTPKQELFKYKLTADTAGFFYPTSEIASQARNDGGVAHNDEKVARNDGGFFVQLFSFSVEASRYGKSKIKVTSPDLI